MTTKDEGPQFELNLEPVLEADNVKSFAAKKNKVSPAADLSNEAYLEEGLETMAHELSKNAKGFIAIVMDAENQPVIIGSGDIEPFSVIGALELAKHELLKSISQAVS